MTTYEVNRSTTNTLTSTTADTITLTQLWGSVRVTNQHTSNWLYATPGGETAVAEADGTVAIPPGQSRTFKAERAEGTNTVVVGVVGNGNVYTVEGMQGTLDEALDDLTAEVDTLANATSPVAEFFQLPTVGDYLVNGAFTSNLSMAHPENGLRVGPLYLGGDATFDRIACRVQTAVAGSTVRLGIYADNGSGRPGALILDAGTVDAATDGVKEIVISQSLAAGLYWVGSVSQGGAPNLSSSPAQSAPPTATNNAGNALYRLTGGYYKNGVAGALPDPATPDGAGSNSPTIALRRSA